MPCWQAVIVTSSVGQAACRQVALKRGAGYNPDITADASRTARTVLAEVTNSASERESLVPSGERARVVSLTSYWIR